MGLMSKTDDIKRKALKKLIKKEQLTRCILRDSPTKRDWNLVKEGALGTVGLRPKKSTETDTAWKQKMILCEHSPIRMLHFTFWLEKLISYVSVHFVRHKHGIEHMVSTQRDKLGKGANYHGARLDKPQGDEVNHLMHSNAQEIIFISRKRLCSLADRSTNDAWKKVLVKIGKKEPELVKACVRDCVYRGHCFEEFASCGFHLTDAYKEERERYLDLSSVKRRED